jgi:hypothetical protein
MQQLTMWNEKKFQMNPRTSKTQKKDLAENSESISSCDHIPNVPPLEKPTEPSKTKESVLFKPDEDLTKVRFLCIDESLRGKQFCISVHLSTIKGWIINFRVTNINSVYWTKYILRVFLYIEWNLQLQFLGFS